MTSDRPASQPDLMQRLAGHLGAVKQHRPPRDPRSQWRVVDALGVSREVASERNAREKATAYDRVCPARECPHRVERWTGSMWIPIDGGGVGHGQ